MRGGVTPLHLTPGILWALFAGIAFGMVSKNPVLTCAALFALWLMMALAWRQGEPPILFFILAYQWLEVMVVVFRANLANQELSRYAEVATTEITCWGSIGGLLMLALGLRLVLRRFSSQVFVRIFQEANRLSIPRIFTGYLIIYGFCLLCTAVAWRIPQLQQLFLGLNGLKWVFYYLLVYVTLYLKKGRGYLATVFFFEIIVGMTSYFSEFKQPIFILIIVYLSLGRSLSFFRALRVFLLALVVVGLGVMWTTIKTEYRGYIRESDWDVSASERLSKIADLYGSVEMESLASGMDELWDRISYTEFFSRAVQNVPEHMPHEGGLLTESAFRHVLVPRFLDPSKPVLDQTALTERYTLLRFADGTSVSIGYMAEFYIDFGWAGVLVGCLLLGALLGSIYRFFMARAGGLLFGYMLASATLMAANDFGMNLSILLGGLLSSFLILATISKFFIPSIHGWLLKKERPA